MKNPIYTEKFRQNKYLTQFEKKKSEFTFLKFPFITRFPEVLY